jgi:peptidoglycan/xylan/chitin deacetylase (PgdA/CDA1 family)
MATFRLDRTVTLAAGILRRWARARRARPTLPILMYHSVSGVPKKVSHPYFQTNTTPPVFRRQMEALRESGLRAVTLGEAVEHYARFNEWADRSVVLTFDDGYRDFSHNALPVLREYRFGATVFVTVAMVGRRAPLFDNRDCMNWEEIRRISGEGTEIGSHAMTHRRFHGLPATVLEYEMGNSKRAIEDETGKPVVSFAIPYAFPDHDRRFATEYSGIARRSGYRCAVTTRIGVEDHPDSLYLLRRIPVNEHDDERLFKAKIEGDYDWMGTVQAAKKYLFTAATDAR